MSSSIKVPVLMYHALVKERTDQLHTVHISIDLFNRQIEWLAKNNYKIISIDEIATIPSSKKQHKYCVLTFDDGYHSLYMYAMPLLKQYGFTATLYLSTAAVGEQDFSRLPSLNPKTLPANDRPLTWDEIKEMRNNGWAIESHSVSHADNSKLNMDELQFEILESKKIIEQQLQQPVLHYAFPFGKYNAASLQLIKESGYKTTATVHAGLYAVNSDPYRLPRLEINADDTPASFAKKIETGFASSKQKLRSSIRNVLFNDPKVKDMVKRLFGKKIN